MAIIWMKSPRGGVFPVNASRKARLEARGFELVKGRPARAAASQTADQPAAAAAAPSSEQDKPQEEPKKSETKKSGAKAK